MTEIKHIAPTAILARRGIEGLIAQLQAALNDPDMTSVLLGAQIAGDSYVITTQVRKLGKPVTEVGRLVEPSDQNSSANSDQG